MARVVLVTGVAREVGSRFARALAATDACQVIGLDATRPRHHLAGVEVVRADVRSPVVQRVVADRRIDTVVHVGLIESAVGRAAAKEANVIGTMQLVAACQKAPSVRQLVLMSSAMVYGSGPLDPARFTETMARRTSEAPDFARDCLDAESYVAALAHTRPEVAVTVLRPADLMGAGVDTPLSRHLSSPVVIRPLGFDARLQFLHPADAVEALLAVSRDAVPGTYNVAAGDVLTLSQVAGILGRPSLGVPSALPPAGLGLARRLGLTTVDVDQLRGIRYGRAMDTSAFTAATGVRPHYTSRRALEEFAALGRPGVLSVERIEHALETAARALGADDRGQRERRSHRG